MSDMFWTKECPARGVLLRHHHDTSDRTTPDEVCSFCGQSGGVTTATVAPPINVTDRLRAIGLVGPDPEDILVEPKAIDPLRQRPTTMNLTSDEEFRLSVNCIELEKRRGYR